MKLKGLCLFAFILLLNVEFIENKCVDSFVMICDNVADVGKFGSKKWTSLVISSHQCEVGFPKLEVLTEDVLLKCPNLEELYIVDRLKEVEETAFQNLPSLKNINLYKNNIPIVSNKLFTKLDKVRKVELKNNNIHTVNRGSFTNLDKLKILNLADNFITSIEEKTYSSKYLKKLILSSNNISIIQPNSLDQNLEVLNLEGNSITYLEDKTFGNLKQLIELNLSKNKIPKLRKNMFAGLESLYSLDVSHNIIHIVEVSTFNDVKQLKILQMAHNQIKLMKPDIFPRSNAMELQSLRLDHNKLSFLDLSIFERLPELHRISIGGNPWQCNCLQYVLKKMNTLNINYTNCDYNHYFTGTHPSCLQFKPNQCIENVDEIGQDFVNLYKNALQNFSYDCP